MNNVWKILSLVLLIVCGLLVYKLYKPSSKLNINEMSLKDIDKESFEYKKKQNPSYAKDLNDYFYNNPTSIEFLKDVYNFDTIPEGIKMTRNIKYRNIGENPYFITNIKVSCGCTVPSYNKEPTKPGDTGTVQIEFSSIKKYGFNMNKLSLHGNTDPTERSVYFKVFVK